MCIYISLTAHKNLVLTLFYMASFALAPWMIVFNFYGNWLLEQMTGECKVDQVAKTYHLTYVILTYILLFMYLVFGAAIREAMSRYFICVHELCESEVLDFLHAEDEDFMQNRRTSVFFRKNLSEVAQALSYAFWLMCSDEDGPTPNDEYEFIMGERNRLKLQRMQNTIKDLQFDACGDEESLTQVSSYSLDDSTTTQASSSWSLLPKTESSSSHFKFASCTICLSDFEKGDSVKQVAECKHTFHKHCLEKWLERRFVCPNCNLEIRTGHNPPPIEV